MIPRPKKRLYYALGVVCVIITGLLSRTLSFIPLFVGDMLYAVMIMMILRTVFLSLSVYQLAIASLCICYGIEGSQLLSYDFLGQLRATRIGRLILGQGFLWSDILAYTGGILGLTILLKIGERNKAAP